MSYEDLPIELLNRLARDIKEFVEDSELSVFEILKAQVRESLKLEFESVIEQKVTPQIKNLEIQSAYQVSKTNEFYAELKKITETLSNSITKNSEVLTSLKSNSATHVEKLEQTIKITNRKADIYDLQALAKEMTTLTPLNTFYQLQE